MKTTQEIAADCGLDEDDARLLRWALNERNRSTQGEGLLCGIIGALYRRIEKLEAANEAVPELVEFAQMIANGGLDAGETHEQIEAEARAVIAKAEGK